MDIGQIAACNIFHLRTVCIHAVQPRIIIALQLEENFTAIQVIINHLVVFFSVKQFNRLCILIDTHQ